jgi:hypothetical protein
MIKNTFQKRFMRHFTKLVRLTPLCWDVSNCVTIVDVVQRAIDTLGSEKYLEIGVYEGTSFCSINIPKKIGVDPIAPTPAVAKELTKPNVSYFALESDVFFDQEAPRVLTGGVDLVFIDGLHTYAQAYRDFTNSLKYLRPNGLIFLHDCLPTSELEARPAKNYEDAAKLNSGALWNGEWVGDVWKVILRLRGHHQDLTTCVLHSDHGIGVVYKASNKSVLNFSLSEIETMSYDDLRRNKAEFLNLRRPKEILAILERLRSARHQPIS